MLCLLAWKATLTLLTLLPGKTSLLRLLTGKRGLLAWLALKAGFVEFWRLSWVLAWLTHLLSRHTHLLSWRAWARLLLRTRKESSTRLTSGLTSGLTSWSAKGAWLALKRVTGWRSTLTCRCSRRSTTLSGLYFRR